ncbi:uncharacterized protein B0P05DRAFT_597563 [Gilbertella persicaria]|uniref:uncharacterized protein n=1 Tax=Gilbertella persicaria TaxID=101096 RepID=UPI00221F9095|nr:uncharacterized protein B0P05DRAFT_597563 [Gilbertella persicaria]KAI8076484.1 hypothetical protein B0P05DRAFT_597563 [Gilbertella persicaria]
MVHWDCDADLVEDHKTSNERLVEIILANQGELLNEWLGKGKGDGKKEPMLRTVLREFHRQKALHRRTTRDIRNAITQLLKKYEATKQLIQSSKGDAPEVMHLDSRGIPHYPNGKDKFEAAIKSRFPFFFVLRPYLEDNEDLLHEEQVEVEEEEEEGDISPCIEQQVNELQVIPSTKQRKRQKNASLKRRNRICIPSSSDDVMLDPVSLKRQKLEMEQFHHRIEYQAKAIELFAKHCPQDHRALEQMVKSFSQNAFPSIEFME